MDAPRNGYTVTMFIIDTSPSMGTIRTMDVETSDGHTQTVELTHLQWGLQYVKLKIQEMIYEGRKTDQCGVIVFGSEDTRNNVNSAHGGYENVIEYIPIAQPSSRTLAKIDKLEPSSVSGDPLDALIVGIETQAKYLNTKKTWTRRIVMLTDAESPIELEDWEATAAKMKLLNIYFTVVGIDFDDEDYEYKELNKTFIKRQNEQFYRDVASKLDDDKCNIGTCENALKNISAPNSKSTKSVLMANVLRIGDAVSRSDEALEIPVKISKATAIAKPKSWKKFILRTDKPKEVDMEVKEPQPDPDKSVFAQLKMRTEFYIDRKVAEANEDEIGDVTMKEEDDSAMLLDTTEGETDDTEKKSPTLEQIEKEELVRGFKYGTTYAPCVDGQFLKLSTTQKGMDICGFFPAKNFRRELSMGEVSYVWADASSPQNEVALSAIVQAMVKREVMAIVRTVSKDGSDPKMGVLLPVEGPEVHYFLWCQMPFADDVRKYNFASLDRLVNKKGEIVSEHPYIPTEKQLAAMDDFVDAMDLMEVIKDEDGNKMPWFNPIEVYNPAVHRVKQAMFHCAVVNDITTHPLPPPHPELTKYFDPPKKVLKKAQSAIEECTAVFKVKEVPKRIARAKKDGHAHAEDEDDDMLLLDQKRPSTTASRQNIVEAFSAKTKVADDSETEADDDDLILDQKKPDANSANVSKTGPLPTPARSVSPHVDPGIAPGRIIGNTYPLKDFRKNLAQGDIVSKAVEDLAAVISEIVIRPFGSRRTQEMIECMTELRNTCLTEDEISKWNSFIMELKQKCLASPGNTEFWGAVQDVGRHISLISDHEARQQGGESNVTENDAGEFILS